MCGSNQKVLDNKCVDCEKGSRRDEGDKATGNDTACERMIFCMMMLCV